MKKPMTDFDFTSLDPVARIALADALYDSAMREIDQLTPDLSAAQLAEIDERIAEIEAGDTRMLHAESVYQRLASAR